jgi:transcription termination/antitermination protein NusA
MATKQNTNEINPLEAIQQYSIDKGLSREIVIEIIKDSLIFAYAKELGILDEENHDIQVEFGNQNDVAILLPKKVTSEETASPLEISLEKALILDPEAVVDSVIVVREKPIELSRIFSSQAKQMVFQKLKDIEREILYNEYKVKEGELTHGYFQRWINKDTMCIDLGKIEGVMPKREQSPGEKYKSGDRLKAIISRVELRKDKFNDTGLVITLSRSSPDFVKKLFEMEIPEIYEGLVEILNIARVPSVRTKIVVRATRSDIDPVGACVGMRGVRIQSIVRELGNERIDIIQYSDNPSEFITNALSPAKPVEVKLDYENKEALVVVPDESLSLAIGSSGSNVKLAVQLSQFKIDIKSVSQYNEEMSSPEARERLEKIFNNNLSSAFSRAVEETEEGTPLSEIGGLMPRVIKLLEGGGIKDIETLIEMTPEDLAKIPGIGLTTSEQIFKLITESVELVEEN